MKKLLVSMLFLTGIANAATLGPEFKVWRSSSLNASSGLVLFSTVPVIIHTIIGSTTWNNSGNSFFSALNSTVPLPFGPSVTVSTKMFASLDKDTAGNGMGFPYDVLLSSFGWINKLGGAVVNVLWDFYEAPPTGYPSNWDTQSRGTP